MLKQSTARASLTHFMHLCRLDRPLHVGIVALGCLLGFKSFRSTSRPNYLEIASGLGFGILVMCFIIFKKDLFSGFRDSSAYSFHELL